MDWEHMNLYQKSLIYKSGRERERKRERERERERDVEREIEIYI